MDGSAHVDALLVGGPSGAPARVRISRADMASKIKLRHLDGYEHFEREAGTDAAMPVYRWTMRTKVAE
ncbi:DUF5988 family protein [Micromonospora tarapacensis]|uniref:DUF5988 family protein n=1 Tax=Micromonospora tarapacensis TaxID=2835305 RepID=UPI001E2B1327|nr:DUF5988 family protein [Micromonospora tarapacensis]